MERQKKKKNWLGVFWKPCVFVPPIPRARPKKMMQRKEEELRAGGREGWPMRIIETAGKTLEQTLVNTDPFNGNQCKDDKCLVNSKSDSNINCRRNGVCYKITCMVHLVAGKEGELATCYFGESGKYMHYRCKEHVSKFNSI